MRGVHLSYSQSSGGRSGHALKDLFTSVILAQLLGCEVVMDPSWARQQLLPAENLSRVLSPPLPEYAASHTYRSDRQHWDGISFDAFERLKRWIAERRSPVGPVHITFTGVLRIHLFQVRNWEGRGLIAPGAFAACVAALRQMYWGEGRAPQPGWPPRAIAIHARRGDVASPAHEFYATMGPGGVWAAAFYQRCIDQLAAEFPGCAISVYSEACGADDLRGLRGARLELGGGDALRRHFRSLVTADLFVPACSSLSVWASYIAAGRVRAYHLEKIRHFRFDQLPDWIARGEI